MTLNEEERAIIVQHRLERSKETLDEAKDLLNSQHWHGATNRLYYACYYAVTALLIANECSSHTHGGAIGLFGKHFVSTGIFSSEQNKLYRKLFDLRQSGDYSDWIIIDEKDIQPLFEPAKQFIQAIENIISAKKLI
ncbi:HEPN domain-containing protein [Candidatus Symbiothrix dinenymphae]|uniref:HEPN domain-containing protein n=1 Tax=Candidatus Symbiothrix dinenymphae TaxID=467085 RepID=UPI0006C3D0AA|nr:HEPN domain-containing protein [Candidatus Symbiothrix dinenymphae]GAP71235.1 hypothetical protein SAMD00024442_1_52 [Candidatus Symbiothrix dinenymphae]